MLFGILPAGRHEVYCTVSRVLRSMDLKEESINLSAQPTFISRALFVRSSEVVLNWWVVTDSVTDVFL